MNGDKKHSEDLLGESAAFDRQISERVENGHIPDLRRAGRCEWFKNNIWRDAEYVGLFFGKTVELIESALKKNSPEREGGRTILEVASGPGHLSLELARRGFNVTGVELSPKCIEVAKDVAASDPYKDGRGALKYICADIFKCSDLSSYDGVVFSCALHHFGELNKILKRVEDLINDRGLIIVSEPVRAKIKRSDALLIYMVRGLLSANGGFVENMDYSKSDAAIEKELDAIIDEFDYKDEAGRNLQSPLDSESSYDEMYPALRERFEEIAHGFDFSFFDRIIGGLRLESQDKEREVAKWLYEIDRRLCSMGVIQAEQFHFVGRKRV